MFFVVLIIMYCGVFVLWSWLKQRHRLPPIYPGSLPLIGNLTQVPLDPLKAWYMERKVGEFSLKCGGVAVVTVFTHNFYVLTDPDDSLLASNACLDKPYLYNVAEEMYKMGLVTAKVPTWKQHRKLLNPAFNQQVLNSFLDVFNEQARILVKELPTEVKKDDFDMEMYLMAYVLKTSCQTTLGLKTDEGSSMVNDYVLATTELLDIYFERLRKFWLHSQFVFNISPLKKKENSLMKTLKDISTEVIRRKVEERQNKNYQSDTTPDKYEPLLVRMLDLADTQDAFTSEEIQDHVNTIIASSYETTAINILFTLILIGSHKDVQSRLLQELNEVFGEEDRNVNKFDLQKLVYLDAVIKESLRIYPPAPRFARSVESDVKLKEYTMPAGSTCIISVHAINRHPMWGADADQFRPERWLDPASLPDNPNVFASFCLGKRNCIGKLYALIAIKVTLVHMLRHYRIASTSRNLQTRANIVQRPVKGYHLEILPREGFIQQI